MNHEQLAAHLALQGWEALSEKTLRGWRYNLTHADHGTVWCPAAIMIEGHDPSSAAFDEEYMCGLDPSYGDGLDSCVDIVDIPPEALDAMLRELERNGVVP